MTPHYARKLQQALLDIGHQVEKDTTCPGIPEINALYDNFLLAVAKRNESQQKKAVDKLLGGLVRWEVGRL